MIEISQTISLTVALVGAGTAAIVQVIKQFNIPKRIINLIALGVAVALMIFSMDAPIMMRVLWGLIAGQFSSGFYSLVKKTLLGRV